MQVVYGINYTKIRAVEKKKEKKRILPDYPLRTCFLNPGGMRQQEKLIIEEAPFPHFLTPIP